MSTGMAWRTFWRMDAAALALGLSAAAGVYCLGVGPALAARARERAAREALGPQEQARDLAQSALRLAQERLSAAKAELLASPLRLEPLDRLNHRLATLTEMAAADGLSLDQVAPGAESRSVDAAVVALRLTGRASFPAAGAFLGHLHAEFADVAVTGFRLSGNPEDGDAPAAFAFDLAWYAAPAAPGADREAAVPLH